MKFSFEVGNNEKHLVEFYFNRMIGNLSIKVDKKPLIRDFRMYSLSLTKTYKFKLYVLVLSGTLFSRRCYSLFYIITQGRVLVPPA
jgi:hypothetical protein